MNLEKEIEKLEKEILERFDKIKDKIYPCLKSMETETKFQIEREEGTVTITLPHIPFLCNTTVFFVIDDEAEEDFQLVQKRMLPLGTSEIELLNLAMKNLIRDCPFKLFLANYGGYALQSSPNHTSSYILFEPLWNKIANEDLKDDLIIGVPARDAVLFVKASDTDSIHALKETVKMIYEDNFKALTSSLFYYDRESGKLSEWKEAGI